jgi:hypothetical protein
VAILDMIITKDAKEVIINTVNNFFEENGIESWEGFCYGDDFDGEADGYEIRTGASKVVLIPYGAEYVIKIPYYGQLDDWDGSPIAYEGAWVSEIDTDNTNDYCELEAAVYDEAVEWGVEDFFVPTTWFCDIGHIPIYVQPRVQPSRHKTAEDNTYKYASIKGSDEFDTDVGASLVEFYTLPHIEKLLQFLKYYHINDVDNFRNGGFDNVTKRHVFWDYAGFRD